MIVQHLPEAMKERMGLTSSGEGSTNRNKRGTCGEKPGFQVLNQDGVTGRICASFISW